MLAVLCSSCTKHTDNVVNPPPFQGYSVELFTCEQHSLMAADTINLVSAELEYTIAWFDTSANYYTVNLIGEKGNGSDTTFLVWFPQHRIQFQTYYNNSKEDPHNPSYARFVLMEHPKLPGPDRRLAESTSIPMLYGRPL
jgi:hypothetical protein